MQTVGLVAAMGSEAKALLRQVKGWKQQKISGFHVYRFVESGWDCWLIESGMGVVRAADATRAMLVKAHPKFLISFGIAGATETDLQIGDVVVADGTCLLQDHTLTTVQPLAKVSQSAWNVISAALQAEKASLFRGTAITTRGSQLTAMRPGMPEHPVLEMETAGILQAAQEQGIPLAVLRAISDGPNVPIPFDLAAMMDEEYNLRIGRIIGAILRHPKILRQALQMGRNSEVAARNAAIAVKALLSLQTPFR